MILGGIAASTGFSAREVESFDIDQLRWWWNALHRYHKTVREQGDRT